MNIGDVFFWETEKAKGHDYRFKYHVFICEGDWQEDHTFLFISSDDVGGDYKITKPPYSFLKKDCSYVSCGSIVTYTDDELDCIGDKIGELSKKHMLELHRSVVNSYTMESGHIKRVCNAIRFAFE